MTTPTLLKVLLAGTASLTLVCAPLRALAQHGGGSRRRRRFPRWWLIRRRRRLWRRWLPHSGGFRRRRIRRLPRRQPRGRPGNARNARILLLGFRGSASSDEPGPSKARLPSCRIRGWAPHQLGNPAHADGHWHSFGSSPRRAATLHAGARVRLERCLQPAPRNWARWLASGFRLAGGGGLRLGRWLGLGWGVWGWAVGLRFWLESFLVPGRPTGITRGGATTILHPTSSTHTPTRKVEESREYQLGKIRIHRHRNSRS